MTKEEELWLELYKYISDKNNHISLEVTNTYWQLPVIKLTKSYVVSNWCSLEDEWETGYIKSSDKCNSIVDCLEDVITKLEEDDWIY